MKTGIVQYLTFHDFLEKMSGQGYSYGMLTAIYDDMEELSHDIGEPVEFSVVDISSNYQIADMIEAHDEEEYNKLKNDDNYILYNENYNYFIDKKDLTEYYRLIYAEGDKVLWQER